MEKTTGLYRLTQLPAVYQFHQNLLGAVKARQRLVTEQIRAKPGARVLDLGCGPADILAHLNGVDYIGIDRNSAHIDAAKTRYGSAGSFLCGDFSLASELRRDGYDLCLCLGLLHHLGDEEVRDLMELVSLLLGPDGRLVCVDPAFTAGQHWIARWFAAADSGQNVRTPDAYRDLASASFPFAEAVVYNDLLRLPYTHCVTHARKSSANSTSPSITIFRCFSLTGGIAV